MFKKTSLVAALPPIVSSLPGLSFEAPDGILYPGILEVKKK